MSATAAVGGANSDSRHNTRARKRPHQGNAQSLADRSRVYDLMVPIPKESPLLHIQEFQQRLASTGFTHMALTHTIFGAPKQSEDRADKAIPESVWNVAQSSDQKKAKHGPQNFGNKRQQQSIFIVLRRMHAVLENLSDVGHFALRNGRTLSANGNSDPSMSATANLLQEYDLISLSPRNDVTFQSACASATACDIITLDYTSGRGGVQLPFKIRPADVKAVIARKAVFEIPYAPALLNRNQRKGLIQTW